MKYRIPKRIIQTGKNSCLPLRARAVVSNLRLHNPDFEYVFFDNRAVEDFIDREFPQYRPVFDHFRYPIQRYDFFRYLAVYRLGGFYFDLDVLLASGLEPLLESECVFTFEALSLSHYLREKFGMDWQMGNYAFGAAAGHPFLEAVINNVVRGQMDPNWVEPMMRGTPPLARSEFFILNSTGPGVVSRTLAENYELSKTVKVLFPDDVGDVANCWNRFGDYGVHLADSSWRHAKGPIRRRIVYFRWPTLQRNAIERARKLGGTRQHPRQASDSQLEVVA